MSELDGVQDVASNNTAGVFGLSADTLAVLYFALNQIEDYRYWLDYDDEVLSDADRDEIDRLVGVATYEVMNMIEINYIGEMRMFAGGAVPPKWMTCTGDAISRTTYADLFAAIGTTWGAGNGTTTFNIPDMRDKIPMGVLGSVVTDVGDSAGALTHTLTSGEMPSHNHTLTDPGHVHTLTDPGHAHLEQITNAAFKGGAAGANSTFQGATSNSAVRATTDSNTTGISVQSHTTGISLAATGGGGAHSILNPVEGVHFMIYTGVL